ncbi:bacterial regulatory protein, gntR family domain-containing protein [Ditylenchus destructor]|uniref:Bacterial regulatory protein, gntR family domain-containing protein n=1 Tax=Ditylenchus destructor TaxID=166010 RepID=A0AAD4MH45_9BILA|nr:bacterial regulatory protein, gntR family domain-containing protein [Ditylenchus destructor]
MTPPDPSRTRALSVADTLRDRIFDGEIAPGSHLMEISLANELGVSRTPVRGAMARLADEGLLVYLPNKGFQVRRFNAKDVYDAFSVRATLEGMCCRLIAEVGLDGKALSELTAMLDEQHELLHHTGEWSDGRAARWQDLDVAFHQKLLALADNRWLTEAVQRASQLPIIFDSKLRPHNRDASMLLHKHEQALQAFADHCRIVEALGRQEAGVAEAAMRDHINANRDLLVLYLSQKNPSRTRALA